MYCNYWICQCQTEFKAYFNPFHSFIVVGFATVGKCKLMDIPIYWGAQYLGAFIGASMAYGVYYESIDRMTGFGKYIIRTN